jgi:hypothetical protein
VVRHSLLPGSPSKRARKKIASLDPPYAPRLGRDGKSPRRLRSLSCVTQPLSQLGQGFSTVRNANLMGFRLRHCLAAPRPRCGLAASVGASVGTRKQRRRDASCASIREPKHGRRQCQTHKRLGSQFGFARRRQRPSENLYDHFRSKPAVPRRWVISQKTHFRPLPPAPIVSLSAV